MLATGAATACGRGVLDLTITDTSKAHAGAWEGTEQKAKQETSRGVEAFSRATVLSNDRAGTMVRPPRPWQELTSQHTRNRSGWGGDMKSRAVASVGLEERPNLGTEDRHSR